MKKTILGFLLLFVVQLNAQENKLNASSEVKKVTVFLTGAELNHEGKIKLKEILVVSESNPPWLPCGLCRQVISEFIASAPGGDITIYATNLKGDMVTTSFLALYPGLFSPSELRAAQMKNLA